MTCECRKHFSVRNFLLEYDEPVDFVQFQCGKKHLYLGWRVIWFIYHLAWLVSRGVLTTIEHGEEGVKWLIYVTNWSYVSLTLSSTLELIAILYVHHARRDILCGNCVVSPWYLKTVWVVFNIGNCSAVVVTLSYWGLLYTAGKAVTASDIGLHILNSVYVVINLSVTAIPVRIYHVFHAVILALVYLVFSVVYDVLGGTNLKSESYIYPQLDWDKPGTAAIYAVCIVFVAFPITHLIMFFIYVVRVAVFRQCRHGTFSLNIPKDKEQSNI